MIKCITLLDNVDTIDGLVSGASAATRPNRLALCVVRRPTDIAAVALSWHDDARSARAFFRDQPTSVVRSNVVNGREWLDARWSDRAGETIPLLVGFIQRAPALTREQFGDYWWNQHRPLADQLVPEHLNPSAYVHNYLAPGDPSPWDGIGELYEQSLAVARTRGEWIESEAAAALIEDERRFLDRDTRRVLVTDQRLVSLSPSSS